MIYIDLYKNLSELLESDSSTTDEESATDEKGCASAEENNPTPDPDDVRVDEEAASSKQSIETLSHVAVRTKSTQTTFKLKKKVNQNTNASNSYFDILSYEVAG